ncbi:MAG TPA: class I SAM-dependent methyltransferase [Kofleriaceae bacterium]|nr:class I SAM-dependent methyltransferase [Kofleriaceae bacterium]
MTADHFRDSYQRTVSDLPWYHRDPEPDLVALFDEVLPATGAAILDLGAGPAVHSIELAARGHHVVAIDGIDKARDMALELAAARGVTLDYRVGDALRDSPEGPFDAIFDRGFLHTLDGHERALWRDTVISRLRPGGHAMVKCFDVQPARDFGPHGLSARDILDILGAPEPGGLDLDLLRHTRFAGHPPESHAAWTILARKL